MGHFVPCITRQRTLQRKLIHEGSKSELHKAWIRNTELENKFQQTA